MRIISTSLLLLATFATLGLAQRAGGPAPRFLNPDGLSRPTGYTHLVEVSGGRTLYIAGQVALDRSGAVVGNGDFRAQAKQVFENLRTVLAAGGATFQNVVKTNTYVTNIADVTALRELRTEYLGSSAPPANTLVQVVRLAREEFLLEIEAIAVVP
jgi:enamine deaminase RidA (YjgF/YER057c/UK114 family)